MLRCTVLAQSAWVLHCCYLLHLLGSYRTSMIVKVKQHSSATCCFASIMPAKLNRTADVTMPSTTAGHPDRLLQFQVLLFSTLLFCRKICCSNGEWPCENHQPVGTGAALLARDFQSTNRPLLTPEFLGIRKSYFC